MTALEIGSTITLACPTITRTTLALYAGASGDHNQVHIDVDACRAVGIDDVFAHGMLSMAFLGRLLTTNFRQEQIRTWEVRFSAITPVNTAPSCTATVTDVADDIAHLTLFATLPDGTETLRGTAAIAL